MVTTVPAWVGSGEKKVKLSLSLAVTTWYQSIGPEPVVQAT